MKPMLLILLLLCSLNTFSQGVVVAGDSGSIIDSSSIYFQLGNTNEQHNNYKQALIYYEKGLELEKNKSGNNTLAIAIWYRHLGRVCVDNNKLIEYSKKSLFIYKKHKRKIEINVYDSNTCIDYTNLGYAWYSKGDYDKALIYYNKALELDKKHLDKECFELVNWYDVIGDTWQQKGNYNKAIDFYEKAISMHEKLSIGYHPDLTTAYYNLGFVYELVEDYYRAIAFYEKALSMEEKIYKESHPIISIYYNSIGCVWETIGNYYKAIAYFEKALAISEKTKGKEHLDTKIISGNLVFAKKLLNP